MPEILTLTNPRARRKSRKSGRSKKKRARASNPVRRRKSRRSVAAPVRRRRRRKSNPVRSRRTRRTRRMRNPIAMKGLFNRALNQQLMPALTQAGGALGIDVLYGYVQGYLPAQFTAGPLRHATKGLIAILASVVASNFVKSSLANDAAKGALTVILHDAGKDALAAAMPSLPLGYYNAGYIGGLGLYSSDTYNPTASLPQPGIGFYENESSTIGLQSMDSF